MEIRYSESLAEIEKEAMDKWDRFVKEHYVGNIFQSSMMVEVYENTKNYIPSVTLAFDNNEFVGVLVGIIQKEYSGLLGLFSSRCIVFGGPLVKDENVELVDALLKEHNNKVKNKAIYTQFRNLFAFIPSQKQCFEKHGYYFDEHLDIHIDLNQPFEKLKNEFHKSRRRNTTKSSNKGVTVKLLKDEAQVKLAYELIKKTYRRVKLPFPDKSLFLSLFRIMASKGMCGFYGAYLNNKLIGARITLKYNGLIYDYYAGNEFSEKNKYPNDILLWFILKEGCQSEYKLFDFGGAGKPNEKYGVRDYKTQFGGELVNYGRFKKINKPMLYKFGALGVKILGKLSK